MEKNLEPFTSASLKIDRAFRHIQELEAAANKYFENNPISLIVEQPTEYIEIGSHVWVARVRQSVPIEMATVVGDAIHNLRAALDLMATDLVRLNNKSTDAVYFPFASRADGLDEQIKKKHFKRAHPDVVALLRSLKPYTGGNHLLRGLHDLDIQDKHQALIPAVSAAKTEPFIMQYGSGVNQIPGWTTEIPRDGWWLIVTPAIENVPIGTEIEATYSLIFRHDTPFPGAEVAPTLRNLRDAVASTVEAFKTLCKGQAFPASIGPEKPNPLVRSLIIGPTDKPEFIKRVVRIK